MRKRKVITAVSILLLAVCTAAGCGQKSASEVFIYGEGGAPAYAIDMMLRTARFTKYNTKTGKVQ